MHQQIKSTETNTELLKPAKPPAALSELYDVVFVLNINSRGWILEKICRVIADQLDMRTRIIFTERNNTITGWLPPARSYFFSHFKILVGAIRSGVLPQYCKKYVWFTHPQFDANNSAETVVAALNQATAVFTANAFHARALEFLGIEPARLTTVLGGADPAQFKPTQRNGKTVGIVGAYYERKNPNLLLATVQALPDVSFLLVAPHSSEVENKSLLWENWAHFPELLALPNFTYVAARYEEFAELYGHMDVYLSLSKLEGGPIPLIEAMFANVYPVVTRTGFADDVVSHGKNGLLLPVSASVCQVVEALRAALTDRSTDIAATVAEYSWEAFGRGFKQVIDPPLGVDEPASFALEPIRLEYLRNGWGAADEAGVWLAMRSGMLRLRIASSTMAIALSFLAEPATGCEGVPIAISINGAIVEEAVFEAGWHVREIAVERGADVLNVEIGLTAELIDELGTIRLDAVSALTRDAVVIPPDEDGLVQATRSIHASDAAATFGMPVLVVEQADNRRPDRLLPAIAVECGFEVSQSDNGRVPKAWDGLVIADGIPSGGLGQLSQCDGLVARTFEELMAAVTGGLDKPAVRIGQTVRKTSSIRPWVLNPKIERAVFFGTAELCDQRCGAWIKAALEAQDIELTSHQTTLEEGRTSAEARAIAAQVAKDADICFFAGREADLQLMAACLAMGVPVLIYGPSELLPALSAFGLRPFVIQNASRLTKTLSMLSRVNSRRSIIARWQDLLQERRGVPEAIARYSLLARGLIAQRELKKRQPRVALLWMGPSSGESPSTIAALVHYVRELGGEPLLFCTSDEVPAGLVDIGAPITLVDPARSVAGLSTSWADPAFSDVLREQSPDLLMSFSLSSARLVGQAGDAGIPTVHVTSPSLEEHQEDQLADRLTAQSIELPKIMPMRKTATARKAYANDRASARASLGCRNEQIVLLCTFNKQDANQRAIIADAISFAGDSNAPARFLIAPDPGSDAADVLQCLAREVAAADNVELAILADEGQLDLAMRAADLAIIAAPPFDATFVSRALAFGLPIVAQSDVAGEDYLTPKVNAAICKAGDRADFQKALAGTLKSADVRRAYSAQAQATFAGLTSHEEVMLGLAAAVAAALAG